jgi:dTDP-4-amino-4,6-dideoxygalactose transaminase
VSGGDEVITVSYSFIATANAVRYCGATPVFIDVDAATGNLDPARIEGALSTRTRAILAVHQFGMPCDLASVLPVAARAAVPVIEDAACAVGSEIRWNGDWQRIGRPHGTVACFSFHPRKLLTTGDGGMLTTNDPALDRRFRLLRQHGMSVSDRARHEASTVIDESYTTLGYNYRLTDVQAAIGREQLKRLPDIVRRRRALASRYTGALSGRPGIAVPEEPEWARTNWQSYVIRVRPGLQQSVRQALLDAGIATRRGAPAAHREPAYAAGEWRAAGPLAASELLHETAIVLPLYDQLSDIDQDRVIAEVVRACGGRP